jgi:hypothetical protein
VTTSFDDFRFLPIIHNSGFLNPISRLMAGDRALVSRCAEGQSTRFSEPPLDSLKPSEAIPFRQTGGG